MPTVRILAHVRAVRAAAGPRLAWLLVVALPIIVAACNQSGGNGY